MTRRQLRSGSLRNLRKVTPSGRQTIQFERRRPSMHKCSLCKKPLTATPNFRQAKVSRLSKARKTPNRPFGGNLCPLCLKSQIKNKFAEKL